MLAAIEKIMVKERIRKEISKITELADDIALNGLLHPVTVMETEDGTLRLLAGLRRLKAVQSLGLDKIDVNVVSPAGAEAALRIEVSENEQREDFTYSEKMDYARLLEEIERAKAKERKWAGVKPCADLTPQGAEGSAGETRQIVASKIGMGKTTYDRAKYIAENAPEEVIGQLDKGERTIRGTYDELRAKEKAAAVPADDAPRDVAVNRRAAVPKCSAGASEEELMKCLSKNDREAARKLQEFHALPPEGKIAELERQLFDMRVRAATAESDLADLKVRYEISVDHKDSIIESLKRQVAGLSAALDEATARVSELDASFTNIA